MAVPEDKEKAHWNELEVSALIDYFYQHRSEVGEGGNFRAKTYNGAAEHVAPHFSQGPKKTARTCKMKWVSIMHLYNAIENYRNRGWEHYDKVQEIVPSARARGSHAVHPSLANAPSLVDDEDDEGGDASAAAVAIIGMQGSIDRLADIFIKSMATPEDLVTTRRAQAMKRVQDVDDGLSTIEKLELIGKFEENEGTADIYLSLRDQGLRQAWIRTKLDPVFGVAY